MACDTFHLRQAGAAAEVGKLWLRQPLWQCLKLMILFEISSHFAVVQNNGSFDCAFALFFNAFSGALQEASGCVQSWDIPVDSATPNRAS